MLNAFNTIPDELSCVSWGHSMNLKEGWDHTQKFWQLLIPQADIFRLSKAMSTLAFLAKISKSRAQEKSPLETTKEKPHTPMSKSHRKPLRSRLAMCKFIILSLFARLFPFCFHSDFFVRMIRFKKWWLHDNSSLKIFLYFASWAIKDSKRWRECLHIAFWK